MKIAFVSESQYSGKISVTNQNMRTELAWQYGLESDHFNIHQYETVKEYDVVLVIFPKSLIQVNVIGKEVFYNDDIQRDTHNVKTYSMPIINTLKKNNKSVCNVQEGPTWLFNEYGIEHQVNFYNQLSDCDILFAHNTYDTSFYKGLFPTTRVEIIPTLMIKNPIIDQNVIGPKENKTIIGGNFCRWYGGFQSYMVSLEFENKIYCPSMHAKRVNEENIPNLYHLKYMNWIDWMLHLKTYMYAVHMMPTVAAGTFSMNCAYYGIPCIGNKHMDTQVKCFPELSVDVNDVYSARLLARKLYTDKTFYEEVSKYSIDHIKNSVHCNLYMWKKHMYDIFNSI